MPDVSTFKSGLSERAFRTAYDDALKKEGGTFNANDFRNSWGSYSTPLSQIKAKVDEYNPVKRVGRAITAGLETQEQSGAMPGLSEEMIKASTSAKDLFDFVTNIKNPLDIVSGAIGMIGDQASLYLTQQTELLGVVNKQAGLTGTFSEDVRDELTQANIPLTRLGIGFSELAVAAKDLVNDSGKFITLNKQSWYEAGAAATAYVGTLSDLVQMYPAFEKIGIGASDVAAQIELTGQRSLSLGLQSSKTTKDLSTNIGKLNEYGFKGGIQGMADMVRKSTEFRINMQSVYDIADKVFDPEGAIDMAANLQAIGGAIGDFNDPMKLMYMATNDAEGLQDALIGAAGGLATYNQEQGRFEITGVNLRKAKAMAKELGISYSELSNGAIAAAERSSAASALMSRGLKLDEDQERFLTNISQMKGGQMSIELNSDRLKDALGIDRKAGEISLDKLTQTQVNTLLEYQDEFKKLSPEEIIQKQATTVENIARDVNYMAAAARVGLANKGGILLDKVKEFAGYEPGDLLKKSNELANKVGAALGQEPIKPTSVNPKTTPQQSVPVDNSKQQPTNTPATNTETQSNKTEVTLNVKSDPIMDEFSRYIVRRPETIDAFLNSSSPRDYTSQ
jgi:cell division septation protein DedD